MISLVWVISRDFIINRLFLKGSNFIFNIKFRKIKLFLIKRKISLKIAKYLRVLI